MDLNSKKLGRFEYFYSEFLLEGVPSDAESRILDAINRCTSLTAEQKNVMICRYIKANTWRSIAEENGITVEKARIRVDQAFRKLKHPRWNTRTVLKNNI